jgi:YVTN family beta-propeller protein
MEYGRYVGRVGALAVALGIGVAVANGGVANATEDPDPSDGSSQTGQQGSNPPENTPPNTDPDPSGPPTVGTEQNSQNDTDATTTPKRHRPRVMILDAMGTVTQIGSRRGAGQDPDPVKQPDVKDEEQQKQRPAGDPNSGAAVAKFTAPATSGPVKPVLPGVHEFRRTFSAITAPPVQKPAPTAQVLTGPTTTATVIDTLTTQTKRQAAAITAPSTLADPVPLPAPKPTPVRLVLNLLSSIGLRPENFPPGSPLAPIGQVLEFVYAGLRRIDEALFNQPPQAAVSVSEPDPKTGVITGRVAYDPDDPLVITTVPGEGPQHGTVAFNDDGTFTYTPDYNQTIPPGTTDSFVVQVTEANTNHLHLAGGSSTITVDVGDFQVAPNNTVIATLPSNGTFPTDVVINPAGDKLYVVYNTPSKITVVNLADNTTHDITVGNNPQTIAFSADGTRAYVPNFSDSTVTVINTANDTVVTTFSTPKGDWDLAVLPNGHLYVVGFDYVADVDPANPSAQTFIPLTGLKGDITLSPDGKLAYVAIFDDKRVAVIDTQTDTVVDSIPVGEFPQDLKTNPVDGTLYVNDDEVAVIPAGSTTATHVDVPDSRGLAVNADGTRLYVANINFDSVSIIDTSTNTVVGEIPISGDDAGPWRIALSPDGSRAYVVNFASGTVSVIALLSPATEM